MVSKSGLWGHFLQSSLALLEILWHFLHCCQQISECSRVILQPPLDSAAYLHHYQNSYVWTEVACRDRKSMVTKMTQFSCFPQQSKDSHITSWQDVERHQAIQLFFYLLSRASTMRRKGEITEKADELLKHKT